MQPAVTAVNRGEAEESDRSAQNSVVKAAAAAVAVFEFEDSENSEAYGDDVRSEPNAKAPNRA